MDRAMQVLEKLVNFTLQRHRVLLSNLANSDTPGYRAKDLDFEALLRQEKLKLLKTDPMHLGPEQMKFSVHERPLSEAPWLDENNVEEEAEMARITENAILYQSALKLLNEKFRIYRSILGR
ncbi:MAG: flagellar basal body rod protein FlgB [Nitrospirae bacterium]|nr:MAG: flagellar basal body rod protein FlgB [Nitrospirota bacterium]